mgnify:CR=1 FL=1|tara:strand:+ start:166 stop:513 length:348 start_codon:yes stop_codon:yes gene_type:complete
MPNILLEIFFKFRKLLVYSKVWAQRTMSWVAILNSGMILFLVLSKLQEYGFLIHITKWYIPIFIGIIFLMVLFGYIEDRAGFHREEKRAQTGKDPYIKEIIERLTRIEKKVKKLK